MIGWGEDGEEQKQAIKEQKFLWEMVDIKCEHVFVGGEVFIYLVQLCQENRSDARTAGRWRTRCSRR